MTIAICPGSFDPVTNGHVDIVERSAKMFDKVIVCILVNPAKSPAFTVEQRLDFLRRATAHLPNVEVDFYSGLLADYAAEKGAVAVVKGLRAVSDFEYEFQQALTNKVLNENLETVFMVTNQKYMYLSSTIVKEVARYGRDISPFIPSPILADIEKALKKGADAK